MISLITAIAAVKKSRRQMLDELKIEILTYVKFSFQNREAWIETIRAFNRANPDPRIKKLSNMLSKKYRKGKWCELLPAAIAELGNEGHRTLLGLNPNP